MKDYLFEKLYRKVDDYFLRNKDWFNQFFILIEKFDRQKEEFYYIEVENLFLETDEEIENVLSFFRSDKAKGDLNDYCHHTSIIYEKFKNNTLKIDDFILVNIDDYFEKVKDRTDDFVNYKRLLLKLKMKQLDYKNIFYYSFPLIGFNKLQGSIHILFNSDERKSTELKISAIFRNTIVVFTEFYERLYLNINKTEPKPDYKKLSIEALNSSFLQDLDYTRFYLNRSLNQESLKTDQTQTRYLETNNFLENNTQNIVTELITKGETYEALEELDKRAIKTNKDIYATILSMKARLALLNKEMINGVISSEVFRTEINKLNYSILMIVLKW